MDAVDAVVLKAAREILKRQASEHLKGKSMSEGLCSARATVAEDAIFAYLNHAGVWLNDVAAKAAIS